MAELSASLTWSVPVQVDELGAHLEAYITLQPTLTAVRLCNRFGRGRLAAITKLPIELVSYIESFLVEEERAKHLKTWSSRFKCWKCTCRPTDHQTEKQRRDLYIDMNDFFECGTCKISHSQSQDGCELTPTQVEELDEILWVDYTDSPNCLWYERHQFTRNGWFDSLNANPTPHRSAFFGAHRDQMLRDFGLEVWTSHTQDKFPTEAQLRHQREIFTSTIAYLTLPGGSYGWGFKRESEEHQAYFNAGHTAILDTEAGVGIPIGCPPSLSAIDARKFVWAINILGLANDTTLEPAPMWPQLVKNEHKKQAEGALESGYDETLRLIKLRLLLRNLIEHEA